MYFILVTLEKVPAWTLVDHELSPWSSAEEVRSWMRRIEAMRAQRPDDEGLRIAFQDVRRIEAMW